MEKKYPKLRTTICETDMKDILIETDAPYLGGNGRRTGCPSMVPEIAIKLSNMFNMTLPDVAAVTTSNTLKLYKIYMQLWSSWLATCIV